MAKGLFHGKKAEKKHAEQEELESRLVDKEFEEPEHELESPEAVADVKSPPAPAEEKESSQDQKINGNKHRLRKFEKFEKGN